MAGFKTTMGKVTAVMQERKAIGATTAEIAADLGRHINHVGGALAAMTREGTIAFHVVGEGLCNNKRRWYAPEWKPASPPHARPAVSFPRQVKSADRGAVDMTGVKVTICPSGRDHRFTAQLPPGYVSSLDTRECSAWAKAVAG